MSLERSKLRMALTKSMGQRLEEARDKAERDIYRHQGATTALTKVEQLINKHTQQVRDELVEAKEGEAPFELDDLISVGKYVVDRMMKLSRDIHTMASNSSLAAVRAEGVKKGYDSSVQTVFKEYEAERNKLESLAQMIEKGHIKEEGGEMVFVGDLDDPNMPRPAGVHPGPPLKEKRKAESKKKSIPKAKAAPKNSSTKRALNWPGKKVDA